MVESKPFVTYLELRESTPDGRAGAGLSHTSSGLVLLHVLEFAADGEPRGAVTFVHDAGLHGALYDQFASHLVHAGWAVALPDLRGHGRSEGERGHSNGIQEVLRDLGDVQDHLAYRQPDAPKVLIGQGLGALWCLAYACEKPGGVAALVLSSPLLDPRFRLPEPARGLMGMFRQVGATSAGKLGWAVSQRTSDPVEQSALRDDHQVHEVITVRAGQQATEAAARYRGRIGSLGMPVLLLGGSEDPIAAASDLPSLAGPNVDVRVFEGWLHDLFLESRRVEVMEFVAQWLDRKLPR